MKKKPDEREWVDLLKALADGTRLKIVRTLLDGPKSVGDLAEAVDASPYNASKHLRVLRSAHIVTMRPVGTLREYEIEESFRARIDREQVLDLGCCVFRLGQLS